MRVAIVGSGIAGLGCARLLQQQGHSVTLFESNSYLGGHTHTIDVTLDGVTAPVDTGFLVFNDRTYPKLVALFAELGVTSAPSIMSFAVRDDHAGLEWAGTDPGALFAQPGILLRPAFWRMLADILRFNRETTALHRQQRVWSITLAEYLDAGQYSAAFRDWYLLPMAAAIWSAPKSEVLQLPLPMFARFCHQHGLLQIFDRPAWRTVAGGGRDYVKRIATDLVAGGADIRLATPVRQIRRRPGMIEVDTASGTEGFDTIVLACHSDQSRDLLADPSAEEMSLLSSVRYQANRVVLHTDSRLMPRRRRAWSAWNYLADARTRNEHPVAVTYWINKLQPLPFRTPVLVTLNPPFEPAPETLIAEFDYAHPLVKSAAVTAQQRFEHLQGMRDTWYAGAWLGHGFHEDGLASAHVVAQGILAAARVNSRAAA